MSIQQTVERFLLAPKPDFMGLFSRSADVLFVSAESSIVLAGVNIGAILPPLFGTFTMLSVGKAAGGNHC